METISNIKLKSVQACLEYFKLLQRYQAEGLLEVKTADHEAYVTQPAIHAMSEGSNVLEQLKGAIQDTVRHIRTYAAWKSMEGEEYLSQSFAVHVVKDESPHDLLYTIILSRRRVWWKLWSMEDTFDVVDYSKSVEEP